MPDIARAYGVSRLTVSRRLKQIRRPDDPRPAQPKDLTAGERVAKQTWTGKVTREALERLYVT